MTDTSLGRLLTVLTSPSKTFQALRERPVWLVALVVLMAAGLITTLLIVQRVDMEAFGLASIESSGRDLTDEQIEQTRQIWDKAGTFFFTMPVLLAPIFLLLGTLFTWVAVKLVGADLTFKQMWSVYLHSQAPNVVKAILSLPAILSRSEFEYADLRTNSVLPSNLGYLAPEETSNAMLAILNSLDVFGLWSLVLVVIGVAIVGRTKLVNAGIGVVAVWALFVLAMAGLASLGG